MIAENKIGIVKRKMYTMMRIQRSTQWVAMLPKVLQLVNSSYLKALGYLRPFETVDPITGSILISRRLKEMNQSKMDKSLDQTMQNSTRQDFFKSENHRLYYSPGKYVFLDAPLGRTIEKMNYAKRFLVYEIMDVDFRQKIRK